MQPDKPGTSLHYRTVFWHGTFKHPRNSRQSSSRGQHLPNSAASRGAGTTQYMAGALRNKGSTLSIAKSDPSSKQQHSSPKIPDGKAKHSIRHRRIIARLLCGMDNTEGFTKRVGETNYRLTSMRGLSTTCFTWMGVPAHHTPTRYQGKTLSKLASPTAATAQHRPIERGTTCPHQTRAAGVTRTVPPVTPPGPPASLCRRRLLTPPRRWRRPLGRGWRRCRRRRRL